MQTETEIREMGPRAKNTWSLQKLEGAGRMLACSPRASRGSSALPTPGRGLPASSTVTE